MGDDDPSSSSSMASSPNSLERPAAEETVRSSEAEVLFPGMRRKKTLRMTVLAGLAALLLVAAVFVYWFSAGSSAQHPALSGGPSIKVGVLHSRSGTMASDERPVIDATKVESGQIILTTKEPCFLKP